MQPRRKSALRRSMEWLRDIFVSLSSLTWVAQFMLSMWKGIAGISPFVKSAGEICPPVAYSFDALYTLLSLIYPPPPDYAVARVNPFLSKASNLTKFSLNVLTVMVFAGVFATTPVGWAIAAGTTLIGWVVDDVIPALNARENYQESLRKVKLLTSLIKLEKEFALEPDTTRIKNLEADLSVAIKSAEQARNAYLQKRRDALWGAVSVAAMVLFAVGAFGFPPIGILGTVLFIGVAVRGIINRFNKPKAEAVKSDDEQIENNLSDVALDPGLVNRQTMRPSPKLETKPEPVPVKPVKRPSPASNSGSFYTHMFTRFGNVRDKTTENVKPFPTSGVSKLSFDKRRPAEDKQEQLASKIKVRTTPK